METTANKNTAILMQLSAYTQYIIPLGNYIFPIIIWSLKKNDSTFVDYNGKQIINFQLSLLVYNLTLLLITVPILLYTIFSGMKFHFSVEEDCGWVIDQLTAGNITWIVVIALVALGIIVALKVAEFFLIIYAAVKNSNGENYRYPLTINFIK